MIAIVYYDETEWLNIISILISLISVATKSLVFSQAIEFSVFIFNWLSLVTDFFGIFCILSWVFYNPNPNPSNAQNISDLGKIWLWQAGIMWIVICLWTIIMLSPEKMGDDLWTLRKPEKEWKNATTSDKVS